MFFLVFFWLGIYASAAGSQDFLCGFGLDREEGATGQRHSSFSSYQSGTVRPVILFGKFKDAADPFSLTQLKGQNKNETRSSADLLNPGRVGSLAHYFKEMSYGTLVLESNNDGVEGMWFEADSTKATDYGREASPNARCTTAILEFAEEVFAAADDTLDFSDYDKDDDGVVDLVILYIPQEFWHKDLGCGFFGGIVIENSPLDYPTEDSVSIQDDLIVVFQRSSFPWLVGVTAHEYGHVMNLPDLYNRQGDASAGIGLWGVMGLGFAGWSYNFKENLFSGPNPLSVWSRHKVGWITEANGRLVTVESDTTDVTLHDIHSKSSTVKAYKVPVRGSKTEYFLLANRQNTYTGASSSIGYYDDSAPASGLAIWHIDDGLPISGSNLRNDLKNSNEEHKRVDLECADGLYDNGGFGTPGNSKNSVSGGDNLDYRSSDTTYTKNNRGNLGDATDLWDGSTSYRHFTPTSNPSTAGYSNNGTPDNYTDDRQNVFSGIAVRNITQNANGLVSIDIRFIPLEPNSLKATAGDKQVVLTWTSPTDHGATITGYAYRDSTVGRKWSEWTGGGRGWVGSDQRYAVLVPSASEKRRRRRGSLGYGIGPPRGAQAADDHRSVAAIVCRK